MILLDTNVFPRTGRLRNVLMSAVLKVAAHRGIRVGISDIVLEESINARGQAVDDATQKLQEALSQASKLMQLESLYIPDRRHVMDEWRRELTEAFEVLTTRGEDALEALRREAARELPARLGKGARDSAIWLCTLRCAAALGEAVHFVSDNREDFADPANGGSLHPQLMDECARTGVVVIYHRNLDSLLSSLSSRSNHEPSIDQFDGPEMGALLNDRLMESEDFRNALSVIDGGGARFFECRPLAIRRIKSYVVDGEILVLADLRVCVDVTAFEEPAVSGSYVVPVQAWVVCESEGDVSDLSVESVGELALSAAD
ncbi:PIN domain-containing protein [Streptomyces racemochromogenes]|uniref:PIN domain-containing protein n=1 Tax=Streptomyces racemochromogenes TaxID=67353 RepID=A0ABW7P9P7_9ACTN